jgi:hypothetical protein
LAASQVLRMVFLNQGNKQVNLSLNNPKDTITAAEVRAVMDSIIAKNIFSSNGGDLVSKVSARIVDTTTNELFTA